MMKYIPVFHPSGCAEDAHSLKLTGSILNITFYAMARRESYRNVVNNIVPDDFSEPGMEILIRVKSTNKKTTARVV